MIKHLAALLLLALAVPVVTPPAWAQDDGLDDLDGAGKKKKDKASVLAQLESEVVREVNKGWFLKANVGSTFYLLRFAPTLSSGTAMSLSGGQDFVDREKTSMSWEIEFLQGTHNGMRFSDQVARGVPPASYIQGDTRTFTLAALYEVSAYPSRRLGVGVRLGGGVMFSPLLMNREYYQREVVQETWHLSAEPAVHNSPHPIVIAGPTLEYYTKLSHFSVGLDVDASYAIGFDLGLTGTGYFKYTF